MKHHAYTVEWQMHDHLEGDKHFVPELNTEMKHQGNDEVIVGILEISKEYLSI